MIESLIKRVIQAHILIAGDVMVDEYVHGDVERISPEAPVPVLKLRQKFRRAGGAGNVMQNVAALGGKVSLFGALGNDEPAQWFRSHCQALGIDTIGLKEDSTRQTTFKTRVVARNQHIVRIDQEYGGDLSTDIESMIAKEIRHLIPYMDAIIVSDYRKGFLTRRILQSLLSSAQKNGRPVVVDPKGTDFTRYRGATYVTPNLREASLGSGVPIRDKESLIGAGKILLERTTADGIIITRGNEGMTLVTPRRVQDFPIRPVEVVDVTGAGDTVVAALALAVASGLSIEDAITLANLAASMAVSRFGAATVTWEQMADHLTMSRPHKKRVPPEQMQTVVRTHKIHGQTIVFADGDFDLLHVGHLEILRKAAGLGDVLVVGAHSDEWVSRRKGHPFPMMPEAQRSELISALNFVDYVVVCQEQELPDLIETIRPDIVVNEEDWEGKEIVAKDMVTGKQVVLTKPEDSQATADILRRVKPQASEQASLSRIRS